MLQEARRGDAGAIQGGAAHFDGDLAGQELRLAVGRRGEAMRVHEGREAAAGAQGGAGIPLHVQGLRARQALPARV